MKRRTFLIGSVAAVATAGGITAWQAKSGLTHYAAYSAALRRPLDPTGGVPEIIRLATLAPNGHNTQPWRFEAKDRAIFIGPDFRRRTPVVDPDDHHLFVSLGAAAENLAIAGRAAGLPGTLIFARNGEIRYDFALARPAEDPLVAAILRRQSTRAFYDGRPVEPSLLKTLAEAARQDGVRIVLLTERSKIDDLRDLVVAGNDAQMSDPAFVKELKAWLRFSPDSAMAHGDGLYSAASGNPTLPDALGRAAFDLVFKKKPEAERYAKQIDSSAGVAVFFGEKADPQHWALVGQAMERFLLEATRQGLSCAFVNQPVEVASLRTALASLAGEKDLRPDLVIRFGRAPALPYAPRRAVADVMPV